MTTLRRKKRNYTDADRRKAVVLYQMFGNFTEVAKQTGFPVRTITDWRHNAEWWGEFAADVREQTTDNIDHSIELGNQVFGEFIRLFERPPHRTALPSR